MATLRPYKQLSLLLLASTSPWIPRALSTLAVTLFELPPSAVLSRATQPPTRRRCWAPRIPAPGPRAGLRGEPRPGAPASRSLREPHSRPAPYLPLLLLGVLGPGDTAPGAGATARSGLRLGNREPGVSCPLSSGLRVAPPHVFAACPSLPTQSVGSGARGQVRLSDATCRSGPRKGPRRNDLRHTKAGRAIQFPGKRLPPHP